MSVVSLFAQYSSSYSDIGTQSSTSSGMNPVVMFFWLAVVVVVVAGMWKTFQKAGHPGWAAIVPLYNTYILLKVAGRPGWWLLLYLIPIANIIVSVLVSIDIARAFGKTDIFGIIALWLFGFLGYLMLGFGPDKYKGVPKH